MTSFGLRGLLVVALLVTSAVHLERWFAGYRDIPTVIGDRAFLLLGPLFLVNVVVGVGIALAVVFWNHWLPLLAAAAFGAATLGAFLADRFLGVFGPPSPLMWQAPEIVAAVAEVLCVVFAVILLVQRRRIRHGWIRA
ncbi:hypothetical protein [Haloechinothrix sp. LS1_15]|uniref:hypothetical protein n=1 Tax=Haloechinothrix sp. LS1_15 TaxID=2652248 RepID=UPI002947E007|nr:hypothetical protein [Haloechinothrix sp. LS1_15]MDV6014079.1 hypothetical protein [Haloechinothrix sp. LS1_15]